MLIRSTEDELTPEEVVKYVDDWNGSLERKKLVEYKNYYESRNEALAQKVADRELRGKTPNYFIPTAYYSTLVDTMAGYMFQNVQYIPEENTSEKLMEVLKENSADIKDMLSGTNALTYNRGIEYIYTEGTPDRLKYKFTPLKTENVILIYNDDIEPKLIIAIRIYIPAIKGVEYAAEVIYKNLVVKYHIKKDEQKRAAEEVPDSRKPLLFSEVPICVYNTEIISSNSSFQSVIYYIKALDWLVTGNTNELDRLVDALLVLGKKVMPEDLEHTEEWKALMDYKTTDRAEYISKEMSPEFREYVSNLLIQEIHKHSHIIDWYSPDSGMTGAVSGKALKTRLFDMDMFSQRIEKVYKIGIEKRLRLLSEVLKMSETDQGKIKVVFNRTLPSDIEEKITAMTNAAFLTDETKFELIGLDWKKELERREAQKERDGVEVEFDVNGTTDGDNA